MGKRRWEDLDCDSYSKWTVTEQLTVIVRWEEWLATYPDGKLPTSEKIEGQREEDDEGGGGERGGGGGEKEKK